MLSFVDFKIYFKMAHIITQTGEARCRYWLTSLKVEWIFYLAYKVRRKGKSIYFV